MNYCKIRKDLVENKTAVPISKKGKQRLISGKAKREYRWVDDDTFQIFYGDSWWEAYSIDFDFFDPDYPRTEGEKENGTNNWR